jgi:hypothetical protein
MNRYREFINTQSYYECVLISALNALNYLTNGEKIIKSTDQRYVDLVDFLDVKSSGINITDSKIRTLWVDELGIYPKWTGFSLFEKRYGKDVGELRQIPLPIQTAVEIPYNGFKMRHAILIIDHIVECDVYQVCNLSNYTNYNGWVFSENLRRLYPKNNFFILFDLVKNISNGRSDY